MDLRHPKLLSLFKKLDEKTKLYLSNATEKCLAENKDDPNQFYECFKDETSVFNENIYKFDGLSLYSDLREKECSQKGGDFEQCINETCLDIEKAMTDLHSFIE